LKKKELNFCKNLYIKIKIW